MGLSSTYAYTYTGTDLINSAFRLIGRGTPGETLSDEMMNIGLEGLNLLIKAWQAEDMGLWKKQIITIYLQKNQQRYTIGPSSTDHCTTGEATTTTGPLETEIATAAVAGAGTITVDDDSTIATGDVIGIQLDDGTVQWTTVNGAPAANVITLTDVLTDSVAVDNIVYTYTSLCQRPLRLLEARRRLHANTDIPLNILSYDEYMCLPVKANAGPINTICYDPKLTDGVIYTWPVCSDVQDRVIGTFKYPILNVDDIVDDAEYPAESFRALKYNLAVDLAVEFKVSDSTFKRVAALAEKYKAEWSNYDREDTSVFFGVDRS